MPTKITDDFLKPYIHNQKRHKAYQETVDIMNRMKVHADGETPGKLLTDARPHESPDVTTYRQTIFVAITKSIFAKVVNCLSKIRKSQDWMIKYDPKAIPSTVKEGDTLEDYCEKKYPFFQSITNWTFNVLLRNYLVDPNAVCFIMPLDTVIPANEYLKPYAMIFNSDRVLDFVEDDYAVIHSTDRATYQFEGQKFDDGDVYYIVSQTEIQKWTQINPSKDMTMSLRYAHGLEKMPCFKLKGVFKKALDTTAIWESRIDAIVPRLNEAVREYSDLQGGVVTSLNMEKWEYTTQDCPECNGTKKVKKGTSVVTCKKCGGIGSLATSPYSKKLIKAPLPGQPAPPMPPAGYIQKPIEILVLQDKRVNDHMWWGLSAINMEFLAQTPLSESGISKEWDRDEFNNFVNAVAEDIVAIDDRVYYFTGEYRYRVIVPDAKERRAMLPWIPVPGRFDMVNSQYLAQEVTAAKTANLSPLLVNALEVDYANKKLQNEPAVKDRIKLVLELDPFPGVSRSDKMVDLQNGGITMEDYVISSNIIQFVNRAIFEGEKKKVPFAGLARDKQTEVLMKFAKEKIKANSAAEKILRELDPEEDEDPEKKPAVK